jgi:hypothetical protein
MATRSCSRNWAATTCAPAAAGGGFKKCCMKAGGHDGSNRHDYFQGVISHLCFIAPHQELQGSRGDAEDAESFLRVLRVRLTVLEIRYERGTDRLARTGRGRHFPPSSSYSRVQEHG